MEQLSAAFISEPLAPSAPTATRPQLETTELPDQKQQKTHQTHDAASGRSNDSDANRLSVKDVFIDQSHAGETESSK